jgi:hypothetical protein
VRCSVPFGSYERLTILGGLALEGLLGVMSIPADTDTPVFQAYLDQVLIPEPVEKKPGAIVVLDNLQPHLVPKAREKLHAAGLRLLYLPPYSPDVAPIEQAWSKLKTLLRTAAARPIEALESARAELLDRHVTELDLLDAGGGGGFESVARVGVVRADDGGRRERHG